MPAPARAAGLEEALGRFGHTGFRPGQREALDALLGGRDVLALLPTGSGKSLIFQVAAQVLEGPVVVVSPLLALIGDQVASLERVGIAAARIDASRGERVREREVRRVLDGEARIAYVTPEQLAEGDLVERLRATAPALVAIDEAHAVSQWGRGFRPAFLGIGSAVVRLGRPPVLALTATADPWVRHDIVESLRMRDPAVIVRGTDRPGLFLEVVRIERASDELREIGRLLVGRPGDPEAAPLEGKGIVYTRTTRAARETARWLADRGVVADYYHGRRSARDRRRVQEGFGSGAIRVVVATNAFGLGIDVPDVRFVIHRHVPANLEAYYQEAGRAGRDGEPARCTLIYRPAALAQAAFLAGTGTVTRDDVRAVAAALAGEAEPTHRELGRASGVSAGAIARTVDVLEAAGLVERRRGRVRATGPIDPYAVSLAGEEHRAAYEHSRSAEMRAYAETDGCRRAFILTHFGEDPPEGPCGRCDNDVAAAAHRDDTVVPPGIGVGASVRHPTFGTGVVQRIADGTVTVVFDDEGYRTLDARLVAEEGLLEPA